MNSLFSFPRDDVITPLRHTSDADDGTTLRRDAGHRARRDGADDQPTFRVESDQSPDPHDQFMVFQLGSQAAGPAVLDTTEVEPALDGSDDAPDVLMRLEMLSFNLGANEDIDSQTRATMRLNVGKDESSSNKLFDTAFWSVAAGLSLYDTATGKAPEPKLLKSDISRAFGNRPIEVPGGLGRLSFQVVKHKEQPWWKRAFGFLQSRTAEHLIALLGFPAITHQAIDLLDELMNRVADAEPEPLFKSVPMRLALSSYARESFTGGNERIRMGCLKPGVCVFVRSSHYGVLKSADVGYFPAVSKLAPLHVSPDDVYAGRYDDPLRDVTYALFRIKMKEATLDPGFRFP
ncbi:MAG: hypothetical protein GY715_21805 [Planctomycetes bacterium]|nr:hypothetical protein [Planctomycetota bacterium]